MGKLIGYSRATRYVFVGPRLELPAWAAATIVALAAGLGISFTVGNVPPKDYPPVQCSMGDAPVILENEQGVDAYAEGRAGDFTLATFFVAKDQGIQACASEDIDTWIWVPVTEGQ